MTDEEMAEEYLTRTVCQGCRNICEGDCAYAKPVRQAFFAGLKAGRPQWHDLRKDPTDLPKDNNEVLVYMWDSYYIGYFNLDSWHFENFSEGKEQADAWCEIPTFDKE